MINLKYNLDLKSDQSSPIINPHFINYLRDYNVNIVDKNPDVILSHQTKTKIIEENGPPIILLERIDSCNITVRSLIKHKRVIAVIKNTIFRDPKINNEPVQYGRYHFRLIAEKSNLKLDPDITFYNHKIPITDDDLKKIELGYTFALYSKMNRSIKREINFNEKRGLDCNFHGTTGYGANAAAVNYHRKLCVKKLEFLKNKLPINCGGNRSLKSDQYNHIIVNSKSSVSPWGLGEACYRDFESIYLGSVLIKPDSSFVLGKQDIYQNFKYYIPCEIDFSDLEDKINYVKTNWNQLKDMRIEARKYLCSFLNSQKLAQQFAEIIKRRLS